MERINVAFPFCLVFTSLVHINPLHSFTHLLSQPFLHPTIPRSLRSLVPLPPTGRAGEPSGRMGWVRKGDGEACKGGTEGYGTSLTTVTRFQPSYLRPSARHSSSPYGLRPEGTEGRRRGT